jgi:hypothetical protein
LNQRVENVRTLAGQAVTISFWAKGVSPGTGLHVGYLQNFGTGGSPSVSQSGQVNFGSLSSEWTRYSNTFTIPSVSDKIIGENSYLEIRIGQRGGDTSTASWELNIWGVQLEAGSVATPFKRNSNSIQGELAACQRYYWRNTGGSVFAHFNSFGFFTSTTAFSPTVGFPVPMRITPTSVDFGNLQAQDSFGTLYPMSLLAIDGTTANTYSSMLASTVSGATAGRAGRIIANNNTAAFIGFSAEL